MLSSRCQISDGSVLDCVEKFVKEIYGGKDPREKLKGRRSYYHGQRPRKWYHNPAWT